MRKGFSPSKPRLVLATDSLEPSGVGQHMLTLAGALRADHEVIIAAAPGGASGALLSRAAAAGFGIKAIDPDDLDGFEQWLGRAADLVHVHAGVGWEGLELARRARSAGLPVVRTEHLPYVLTDPDQVRAYGDGLADVDRVIAVSEASRLTYAAAGVADGKLATVRNGIDPLVPVSGRAASRAALGFDEADRVALVVARFTAQKGHRTLVAALPAILAIEQRFHVLLVGEGPDRAAIEDAVAAEALSASVHLLGQREDVAELMAAADLLVLPSEFEGLPLVLLEAMAAGLPIVATAIGGSDEALGADHPYRVPPRDPHALAASILALLADPDAAQREAEAGKARFSAEFQSGRMAAETRALYAPLLALPTNDNEREPSMANTRIGFIGVGGIAHRHLGVLEQFEDVTLAAFADLDFARAEETASRFGARAYADHAVMLEAGDLDAVYICIPPFAHGEAERAVIAKGLPFFVEKPLSLDLALAESLADEVLANGIITAVGYHWRYLDTVEEAKRLLADRPAAMISGYWLDQTPPPAWWWKQSGSGGQMVEQTTHIIDLARHLVGEVDTVFGLAGHRERDDFPGLDVATTSTASLRFKSGAIGNIGSTCLLRWGHRVGLHLFGDGLAIELTDHDLMVDVGAGRPYRHAEGDPVWREDRDFIDAVRGGENRIRSPYAEALATHRVALAIARSAETGQPVTL